MLVTIVGGGISGLSLALSLHQVGIACRVYEAVPSLSPLGHGINLQPNAVRELYDLGIGADDLDRIGLPMRTTPLGLSRKGSQVPLAIEVSEVAPGKRKLQVLIDEDVYSMRPWINQIQRIDSPVQRVRLFGRELCFHDLIMSLPLPQGKQKFGEESSTNPVSDSPRSLVAITTD